MSICGDCQFSNPDGMKFCGSCGSMLSLMCPSCNFSNPADFKFCGKCGGNLQVKDEDIVTPPAKKREVKNNDDSAVAERRQLTVMFCDLADSAALSDSLDPEEFHNIIQQYQAACAEVITHYGGYIAQYLGDGILVYFCYPRAHEDDPRRAVYSALACLDAITTLNKELAAKDIKLNIRIGIHTGLVVTGEIGTGEQKEQLALGKTPNIAARLQNLAKLNSVFITETTLSLIKGFFETDFQGQHKLKGINTPVDVYQVTRENDARDRIDVALRLGGLLPIVGRENEMEQLSRLWTKATNGDGQVVLLKGEGGVGKSRLMQAFIEQLNNSNHHYLCANGMAFSETSILRPIIGMLQHTFSFSENDSVIIRFNKMENILTKFNFKLDDYVPLFASLLNLPLTESYSEPSLSPELKKRRTLEMVFELVQKLSQERPLLFVVEDLHWLDPSTLEFLDMLVLQEQTHKIFVFLTCRPNFTTPWYSRSNLVQFNLTHLNKTEIVSMVNRITNNRSLPKVLLDEIVAKTDGIPLFIEELTKMVVNSNIVKEHDEHYELVGDISELSIPSTLQDLLNARLDNLGAAKKIAQLASVIGREFSFDMLLAISDFEEEEIYKCIDQLIDAELISQRGIGSQSVYIFKHALIQDAAMSSMLKRHRQKANNTLASVLEERYPDMATEQPELVAHHYTEAGEYEKAIDWWLRAEQNALLKSAYKEAISHFEKGIALIHAVPETQENALRELRLCAVVGAAFCATSGYASEEVKTSFERARELLTQVGDIPEKFQIMWGLYAFYVVRADLEKALDNSHALLTAAEAQGNTLMQIEGHASIGLTSYFCGDIKQAKSHMEAVIQLDNRDRDRSFIYACGQDASVTNAIYYALTLWLSGQPQQAIQQSEAAVELARELNHPFSIVFALHFSSWLHYMLRQPDTAAEYANEVIRLSLEQGFFWVTQSSIIAGWAQTLAGNSDEGLSTLRTGLDNYRGAGAGLSQTYQLSIEAASCLHANLYDRALSCLQEAFNLAEQTQEKFWLADIYRLMGETFYQLGDKMGAEASLLHAIEIAVQQQSPMLRLRAATSYARLTADENKAAALSTLQQALAAVSDDADVLDIQEAKSLLETNTVST